MLRLLGTRLVAVVALALLVTLVATSAVSAASLRWTSPTVLRETRQGVGIVDAAFNGANVAIVWQETRAHPPHITLKTSIDGGLTFSSGVRFTRAQLAAVDQCGDQVMLAYTQLIGPRGWQITLARGAAGGTSFTRTPVTSSDRETVRLDVACASGRVFVGWIQRAQNGYHLYLATAPLRTGVFDRTYDLGPDRGDEPRGLQLAAGGEHLYALYGRAGDHRLEFRRWTVSDTPNYPVTSSKAQYVTARSNCTAWEPVIGADGDRVVIAWSRIVVVKRVSTDAGRTWGPAIGWDRCPGPNTHVDGGSWPLYIAVSGRQIALSYWASGLGNWETLLLSHDDFATSTQVGVSSGWRADHHIGFVTVHGKVRLADAFGVWGRWIGYRRQR